MFLVIPALLSTLDLLQYCHHGSTLLIEAARIKIHTAADNDAMKEGPSRLMHTRQVTPAPESACVDVMMINGSGLPEKILNDTRFNTTRVRFYSSTSAKGYIISQIFTRGVSGLQGTGLTTVGDIFTTLLNKSCYPFFFGGLVRDQFLGKVPGDVDVEVDCDIFRVYDVCVSSWGEENCQINTRTLRAHIGQQASSSDDLLDFASTDATFFAPLSALEYTVNSLAYDVNGDNNIIVDLPGTGVTDVCNKTIRIPSDDASLQSWDEWRNVTGGSRKLYRFWKLRTKNFIAIDDATQQYIVNTTISSIERSPNSFKSFYCSTVFGPNNFNNVTNTCEVTQAVCTAKAATAENYKQRFQEDFGDYYNTLETMLEKCGKCMACTLLQAAVFYQGRTIEGPQKKLIHPRVHNHLTLCRHSCIIILCIPS